MKHTIIDVPQGTEEWFAARAGRLTGSRAGDMMAKGQGKTRARYLRQLAAERLTSLPAAPIRQTAAMQHGTETEPFARMAYELATGHDVRETGFLQADDIMAGCSLDGDVDGMAKIFEAKCPDTTTHLEYLLSPEALFAEYRWQVTHNLWVSGAASCDLVSYDPRILNPSKQLVIINIPRSRCPLTEYEAEALAFLKEVDELVKRINQ